MTKKCPYCVAEIPAEARKCKFCGEWVEKPPTEAPPAEKAADAAKPAVPFMACPSCQAAAPEGSLLCVQCGYDVRLGQRRYVRYQPPAPPKEEPGETTPTPTVPAMSRRWRQVLAGAAILTILVTALVGFAAWQWSEQRAAYQEQAVKSFTEIGTALQVYVHDKGHFPANIRDAGGKPLLSWRVALLPYLNQDQLYEEFKKDEPWDSEHNRKLLERMPAVYAPGDEPSWLGRRNPRLRDRPAGHTFIQGFVGEGTLFADKEKITREQVEAKDGLGNTLALVDAGMAVPWTKPEDIPYDPGQPLPALGGRFAGGKALAVLGDAKPVAVRPDAETAQLRAYITFDDQALIDPALVFGDLPSAADGSDFFGFWGPIVGGSALVLLLLVVFVRWWLVMADG